MARRMTDTDKWKKPFIKGLPAIYKLLWMYICDDCDHAGIWHVDMDVVEIRVGPGVSEKEAIKLFGSNIKVIDGGKWFIPGFIEFQYGELKDNNNVHKSVIQILKKYGLHKPLTSPLQGAKDKDKEQDKEKDKDIADLKDYEYWMNDVVSGNDPNFSNMLLNERIRVNGQLERLARDHLGLLSEYPKKRPPNQHAWRQSLMKYIRENFKENKVSDDKMKKFDAL